MRFPDFSDPWQQTTLGEILKVQGGYAFKSDNYSSSGIPIIRISNLPIYGRYVDLIGCTYYPNDFCIDNQFKIQKGELLIAMSGATTGKTAIYNNENYAYLNQRVGLFRVRNNDTFYPFLYAYVETDQFKSSLEKLLITGAQPNISSFDIEGLQAILPSLPEQRKIASFLSLLDERIEAQRQTISHLYSLSTGFYQCILNRRKTKWSKVFLREVMTVRKEKNLENAEVHSVSVKRGIINQIEHLGRSFAAKDTKHYNLVYNGDLVYTKSPTGQFPFGIVKQSFSKKPVAVSPLYGVYIPANICIGRIIHSFFLSSVRTSFYLGSLVQKGAKNTMNITTEHFLDNKIYLPSDIEEQEKIASVLSLIDEQIEVEEELLQKYEEQKKYLLQQMFV